MKVDHLELAKFWDVGKALWLKEPQAVFLALQSHNWSDNIEDIMTGIKGLFERVFCCLHMKNKLERLNRVYVLLK